MSGGHFNYSNDTAGREIFGYGVDIDYGEPGRENAMAARRMNPLEDPEISELVFDVFCLLHSFDWYVSGDTGEDQYYDDIRQFKSKWFGRTHDQRVNEQIDKELQRARENLRIIFGTSKE